LCASRSTDTAATPRAFGSALCPAIESAVFGPVVETNQPDRSAIKSPVSPAVQPAIERAFRSADCSAQRADRDAYSATCVPYRTAFIAAISKTQFNSICKADFSDWPAVYGALRTAHGPTFERANQPDGTAYGEADQPHFAAHHSSFRAAFFAAISTPIHSYFAAQFSTIGLAVSPAFWSAFGQAVITARGKSEHTAFRTSIRRAQLAACRSPDWPAVWPA
jgi:hypothetical protein